MMCDEYLQKDLFKNIVLAGGSSMCSCTFLLSTPPHFHFSFSRGSRCVHQTIDAACDMVSCRFWRENEEGDECASGGAPVHQYHHRFTEVDARSTHASGHMTLMTGYPRRPKLFFFSFRKYAAWIGGSMYASLGTFKDIKMTQQEYVQDPNIVHMKYLS